jgi:hypothetical protein
LVDLNVNDNNKITDVSFMKNLKTLRASNMFIVRQNFIYYGCGIGQDGIIRKSDYLIQPAACGQGIIRKSDYLIQPAAYGQGIIRESDFLFQPAAYGQGIIRKSDFLIQPAAYGQGIIRESDSLIQPAACGQGIDGLDLIELEASNNHKIVNISFMKKLKI